MMAPHPSQTEVLENNAAVRVVAWGRRAGKTVLCQLALRRYHPSFLVVDDAESLNHEQVSALGTLVDLGMRLLIAGTPNWEDKKPDPYLTLAQKPGAELFQGPSWLNTIAFPDGSDTLGIPDALKDRT